MVESPANHAFSTIIKRSIMLGREGSRQDDGSTCKKCGCTLFRQVSADLLCTILAEYLPLQSLLPFYQAVSSCSCQDRAAKEWDLPSTVWDVLSIRERQLFSSSTPTTGQTLATMILRQAIASMLGLSKDKDVNCGNQENNGHPQLDSIVSALRSRTAAKNDESKNQTSNADHANGSDKILEHVVEESTIRMFQTISTFISYHEHITLSKDTSHLEIPVWCGTFPVNMLLDSLGRNQIHQPNITVSMPVTEQDYSYNETNVQLQESLAKYFTAWHLLEDHSATFLAFIPQPYNFLPIPPYGRIRGCQPEDRDILRQISHRLDELDLVLTVPMRAAKRSPVIVRIISPAQARRRWSERNFGQPNYKPPFSWVVSETDFGNNDGLIVSWEYAVGCLWFRPVLSSEKVESLLHRLVHSLNKHK